MRKDQRTTSLYCLRDSVYHLSKVALERAVLSEDVRKQRLSIKIRRRDRETRSEILTIFGEWYDYRVVGEVLSHKHQHIQDVCT